MAEETFRPKLRIVRAPRRVEISAQEFQEPGPQGVLFPLPRHGLLIFVYFPDVSEDEFRGTLEYAKPSFVLEMRSSPRFDVGRMNRQLAFQAFQNHNVTYLDLTSSLMGQMDREAVLGCLRKFLQLNKPSFDRPVVFLMNRNESDEGFTKRVLETVTNFSSVVSEVYEVPSFTTP